MGRPNKVEFLKDELKKGELEKFLTILLDHGYQVSIWDDGTALCIEYDWKDIEMATCELVWIDTTKQYVGDYDEDTDDE